MSAYRSSATVVLDRVPPLASVYASALPTLWRRVREAGPDGLPEMTVRVAGASVSQEKLIACQRLMGDTVRDEVPSVLLHSLGFPVALWLMARRDFPLPLLGLVHLSNAVEHREPVRPGEPLDVEARATRLRPHHAGTAVEIVTVLRRDGRVVWSGTSLYLAKGVTMTGTGAVPRSPRESFEPPATVARWRLGADTGRRYAAVSGDYNPIHLSVPSARMLGLKAPIAHGMYLAGRALVATAPHGTPYRWDVSFAAPVSLPSTVEVGALADYPGAPSLLGWDPHRRRPHFTLRVGPLPADRSGAAGDQAEATE